MKFSRRIQSIQPSMTLAIDAKAKAEKEKADAVAEAQRQAKAEADAKAKEVADLYAKQQAEQDEIDRRLDQSTLLVEALMQATLRDAGLHYHRGEWRRRRDE